jgi:PAS domain S-box-containing protein
LRKQRELINALYSGDASGAGVTLDISSLIASGDVCTIVIGAEKDNLGIIQEAGRHLQQILGYDPVEMINKNISCIIPEPFSSMHDKMLQSYIDTGKGTLMGKTRVVPVVNAGGFLQNIILTLIPPSNPADIQTFVAMI